MNFHHFPTPRASVLLALACQLLMPASGVFAGPNCSPIRLDPERLGPIESQSNAEFCYAYATADLVSWELKQRVSAADIALTYDDRTHQRLKNKWMHSELAFPVDPTDKSKKRRSGGLPDDAFRNIQQIGACLEQDMPSEQYLVASGKYGEEVQLANMLRALEQIKTTWDQTKDLRYPCRDITGVKEIFPWMNIDDLVDILKDSDPLEFVSRLHAKNCDPRRIKLPATIEPAYYRGAGRSRPEIQSSMVDRIDQVLTGGRPVVLGVSADFVGLTKAEGYHAVTLAGRRKNPVNGQCEYLVRDSRIAECNPELHTCDPNGEHWASEKLLLQTLETVYYVRDKQR